MRLGRTLVFSACALLALAAPVAAAPGSLQGRTALPIEIEGPHAASADDGAFVLEGPDGAASLLLQDAEGRLERVIHRAYGYVNPNDPKLEVVWDDKVERKTLPLHGALLSLTERRTEFALLADQGPVTLASGPRQGGLLTGFLDTPHTVDYTLEREISVHLQPPSGEDAFSETLGAGLYQTRALDGRVTVEAPFRLFVSDAVLGYFPATGGSQDLQAHFRTEERPGALYNPLTRSWSGPGTHTEYVQEYLLLDVQAGRLDIQFADTAGFLYSQAARLTAQGTAFLPAFEGTVVVAEDSHEATHRIAGEDLELQGDLQLALQAPDRRSATTGVSGDGDFTYVAYGAVAASYDWAAVATAVGLGAALLAAGAWFASQLKAIGSGALLAGYARFQGPQILEHPGRQQVYDAVKANPGVSFMQLARTLGFGESTLTYHLRVLERNEFVNGVKDGRYLRYYDRQSGAYAGEKKVIASALRNPTSAAIAQEIQRRPGVAQRDLAEAFDIAPSTVNWHIRRLSGVGLVCERRDHPHTRYYLGEAWAALPAEEHARFAVVA